jgi:hypothetical protein
MRVTLVEWSDDGAFLQIWRAFLSRWINVSPNILRAKGWVGRVYGSSLVPGTARWRLIKCRTSRLPSRPVTWYGPLWRLICVWETNLPPSRIQAYGELLGRSPRGSVFDGGETSTPRIGTTLISGRAEDDD